MIDAILNAAPAWALTHAAPLLVMVPLFLAPALGYFVTNNLRYVLYSRVNPGLVSVRKRHR